MARYLLRQVSIGAASRNVQLRPRSRVIPLSRSGIKRPHPCSPVRVVCKPDTSNHAIKNATILEPMQLLNMVVDVACYCVLLRELPKRECRKALKSGVKGFVEKSVLKMA